jgi:hypothetical protein
MSNEAQSILQESFGIGDLDRLKDQDNMPYLCRFEIESVSRWRHSCFSVSNGLKDPRRMDIKDKIDSTWWSEQQHLSFSTSPHHILESGLSNYVAFSCSLLLEGHYDTHSIYFG